MNGKLKVGKIFFTLRERFNHFQIYIVDAIHFKYHIVIVIVITVMVLILKG